MTGPPFKTHEANPVCSFCGKSKRDVKQLIAGPLALICNDCVGLCVDIIADAEAKKPEKK